MGSVVYDVFVWFGWALIVFVVSLVMLVCARVTFAFAYRGCNVREELVDKDNPAMAFALAGYVLGMALAIGGALTGPALTMRLMFYDLVIYGPLAIVLMLLSHLIGSHVMFRRFNVFKEIVTDRNCGTGVVMAAIHIAMGLTVYGAIAGEGTIVTAFVFWLLGQLALIVATWFYGKILPFDLHREIEKDNVAVGIAFAGVVISAGNIVRYAIQGNFVSWTRDIVFFIGVMFFGGILLPISRWMVERFILSGRSLMQELVLQREPNIGAAIIEAVIYIALSFLIGWSVAR